MSRMNTQERTIFLNNLDRMLSLLNCTYKNINIKYDTSLYLEQQYIVG